MSAATGAVRAAVGWWYAQQQQCTLATAVEALRRSLAGDQDTREARPNSSTVLAHDGLVCKRCCCARQQTIEAPLLLTLVALEPVFLACTLSALRLTANAIFAVVCGGVKWGLGVKCGD